MLLKEGSRDWWFVAAVVLLSVGANLPESITHQFSFDRRILLICLVAIVVVSLVKYLRLTLVIVTLALLSLREDWGEAVARNAGAVEGMRSNPN